MPNAVIKVEGLSKRYRIGQYVGGAYQYRALRDVLTDAIYTPFRRLRARVKQRAVGSNPTSDMKRPIDPSTNFIWALKDVSFEVKQGEVVGIIGRNGAGKTTLLKVLSRITEPTKGRAEIKGRIGSLLEVGAGFHPELTGWENVYLSGAVLGMVKKEIDRKFDEIVDFSGVEKFIDTPVKRYSSGMLVRLGFAVAAHLEPEILLVDEVLAVGDAAFQKKCLGKMGSVTKEGRTVLFVSHNMGAIRKLCPSVILLEEGKIALRGDANQVVDQYLSNYSKTSTLSQETGGPIDRIYPRDPSKIMQIRRVRILDQMGTPAADFDNRYPFTTELEFEVLEPKVESCELWWGLYTADDTTVCGSYSHDINPDRAIVSKPGSYVARLKFPGNILNAGLYRLGIETRMHDRLIDRHDVTFHVLNGQSFGQDSFGQTLGGQRKAVLLMPLPWQIEMKQTKRD